MTMRSSLNLNRQNKSVPFLPQDRENGGTRIARSTAWSPKEAGRVMPHGNTLGNKDSAPFYLRDAPFPVDAVAARHNNTFGPMKGSASRRNQTEEQSNASTTPRL